MILKKIQLPKLIDDLIKRHKVYAPIEKDGITCYDEIRSSSQVTPNFQSKLSSKDVLFPKCEILFSYQLKGKDIKLEDPQPKEETTVLMGIPPCEARAFTRIDKAFSGDFEDSSYLRRRENTIIIGKACEHPQQTCFCTSVGDGPFGKEGVDLLLQDLGSRYLLEAVSAKGEKLIKELHDYDNATHEDLQDAQQIANAAKESIKTQLMLQGIEEKLKTMFDDPIWNTIYLKCAGCGVCTYLCPTCYCFDIVDEASGSKGKRVRVWDSCQFSLFTLQGSGENPRPTGKARMRQRIMHKFEYFPKNFDTLACVGCGRCIRECPVNLDIRNILKMISIK
ncbi:MAG: 4Fe-4S dicluster domain-containing protein [Candidatus Bathyarchaeota archaeon]|nr:MAG: 4Fe-4S dicluster domain-containing protein [Candidatus Bathyarchaeota archaeon]